MPVLDLEDVDTMPLRPGTDLASPVSPGSRQPRVSIIQREGGLPDTLTVSSIKFTIPKVERQILSDINFSVQSGEMLAIMGPSGAGKTTLLDVMALEAHAGISEGCVQLNGHDMSTKVFTEQCALVRQQDSLWAHLTCREYLDFAIHLSTVGSAEEKTEKLELCLTKLGLQSCADTIVGNEFQKGLSGGQKRRLSVAVAMMKNPRVLMLDEPTSGLDSAAAASIMKYLGQMVREENIIIVSVIHQPSAEVFNLFDKLVVLSDGQVAFAGRRCDTRVHFEGLGYVRPDGHSTAEWVLDLVNKDFADAAEIKANILDKWVETGLPAADGVCREMECDACPSFGEQFFILLKRHALLRFRDPMIYTGRIIAFLLFLTFVAALFHEGRDRSNKWVMKQAFALYWISAIPTLFTLVVCYSFHKEFSTIKSEVKNRMVNVYSYLLVNVVIKLLAMIPLVLSCLGISMFGVINAQSEAFFPMFLLLYLCLFHYECVCEVLGAYFVNPVTAMLLGLQYIFSAYLFCGFFLAPKDIFWPVRVFYYTCPLTYVFQSFFYEFYQGLTYDGATIEGCETYVRESACLYHFDGSEPILPGWQCPVGTIVSECFGVTGSQILKTLHGTYHVVDDDDTLGVDVLFLIGFCVYFQLVLCHVVWKGTNTTSTIINNVSISQGEGYQQVEF